MKIERFIHFNRMYRRLVDFRIFLVIFLYLKKILRNLKKNCRTKYHMYEYMIYYQKVNGYACKNSRTFIIRKTSNRQCDNKITLL